MFFIRYIEKAHLLQILTANFRSNEKDKRLNALYTLLMGDIQCHTVQQPTDISLVFLFKNIMHYKILHMTSQKLQQLEKIYKYDYILQFIFTI